MRIGWVEGLIIFGILIFLFGATKLPAMGRAIGQSIKEFKKGVRDADDEKAEKSATTAAKTTSDENKKITQH
ncbi:MAG: twin-arginine translocase TatA/TatE family subunit [Chloroflexi bacterium]|nr:twin-arginine translocase TatA/TatE family subunit [Chloroflexota bacterium]